MTMNDDDPVLRSDLCCWSFSNVSFRNRLCRAAGLYFFVLEGICIGLWGMVLPTIATNLELSDAKLGTAALCTYFGTLLGTPLAAHLIYRVGVRRTALISTLGFCISLPLIAAFNRYAALLIIMLAFGIFWGITDVMAGNATVLAEIVGGKSYMGTNYGVFSLTAGFVSLAEQVVNSHLHQSLCGASLVLTVLNVLFSFMVYDQLQELYILEFNRSRQRVADMCPDDSDATKDGVGMQDTPNSKSTAHYRALSVTSSTHGDETIAREAEEVTSTRSGSEMQLHAQASLHHHNSTYSPLSVEEDLSSPSKHCTRKQSVAASRLVCILSHNTRALLVLGTVAFIATFCESCMITWIVVYYKDVLHATPAHRAVGFGCMMVSMAVARFLCDFLRTKYSTRQIVFAASLLLVTGLWLVFGASFVPNSVVFTSLGMVLVGLGTAPLNPITFSSAGHLSGLKSSGSAVATVAACAYSGSIVCSPLVGVISDAAGSLRYGFLFVAVVGTFIIPLSVAVTT